MKESPITRLNQLRNDFKKKHGFNLTVKKTIKGKKITYTLTNPWGKLGKIYAVVTNY